MGTFTVAELIKQLKEMPQNAYVYVITDEEEDREEIRQSFPRWRQIREISFVNKNWTAMFNGVDKNQQPK